MSIGILIDRDDVLVRQNGFGLVTHRRDIVTGDERCCHHCPEIEMRLLFVGGHAAVADLKQVGIVPTIGNWDPRRLQGVSFRRSSQ